MNNEMLEKINYLKLGVDNAKSKETGWIPVPLSHLIPLLNELERINNLEPIGYIESNGINYINRHGFTHINAEQSGSINIPLYKLD